MKHNCVTRIQEDQAIKIDAISLRQAAARLEINPREVKGMAVALGVELEPNGTSLLMSQSGFEVIRRTLESRRVARAATTVPA